jgi:ABC-type nitrate/sulfonate/bicarbonate transport system permease component
MSDRTTRSRPRATPTARPFADVRDRVVLSPVARGVFGVAALILLWTIASLIVPGRALPSPWTIVTTIVDDGWDFYWANLSATFSRMLPGYVIGNVIALSVAAIVLLLPPLNQMANQLGVVADCLPITAVGPLVMIMFGGGTAAIFLAGLVVFYTSLVTSLIGVHAAKRSSLELVRAYGGGRWARLRKVQVMAALPSVFTALKLAVPGAFIGALVGEYLGGIDVGIGVALQAAQRDIMPARTFGLSIVIGLLSLGGYLLIGWIGNKVLPWAAQAQLGGAR